MAWGRSKRRLGGLAPPRQAAKLLPKPPVNPSGKDLIDLAVPRHRFRSSGFRVWYMSCLPPCRRRTQPDCSNPPDEVEPLHATSNSPTFLIPGISSELKARTSIRAVTSPLLALQAVTTAMSASNAPTAANKLNGWTPKLMARDVRPGRSERSTTWPGCICPKAWPRSIPRPARNGPGFGCGRRGH